LVSQLNLALKASKASRALRALAEALAEGVAEAEEEEEAEALVLLPVSTMAQLVVTGASTRKRSYSMSSGSTQQYTTGYRTRTGFVVYRSTGSRRLATSIRLSRGEFRVWWRSAGARGS
jgi:hypothetical protein